jgi:hypothetical protein
VRVLQESRFTAKQAAEFQPMGESVVWAVLQQIKKLAKSKPFARIVRLIYCAVRLERRNPYYDKIFRDIRVRSY